MRKNVFIGLIIFLFVGCLLFNIVQAVGSVPGSEDDPLITESYFEQKIHELLGDAQNLSQAIDDIFNQKMAQTNSSISILNNKVEDITRQIGEDNSSSFKVVNVTVGQKIICEESTEIILRAGKAKAISQTASGLSDVTQGKDIKAEEYVEKNHLLIIPRTDGRGLVADTNVVLMIKGEYELQ